MRDMIERDPPRSSFLSLLSRSWQGFIAGVSWFWQVLIGGVSRLWQRLMGEAAPAEELLIQIDTPMINTNIASWLDQRADIFTEIILREPSDSPTISETILRDQSANPTISTRLLDDIYGRDLNRTGHYHNFNFNPRWYYSDFNRGWHEQPTARDDVYHWWNRESLLALPDPEDFRNASKLSGSPNLDIPEDFICAITREIMTDPVYDPSFNFSQQRYDRHAIERWLIDHPTNPYTRAPLTVADLVADDDLKARIDAFVANALETSVALIPRNG